MFLGVPQLLQRPFGCRAHHPVIVVKGGVQMRHRPGVSEPAERRRRGHTDKGRLIVQQVNEGFIGPGVTQTPQRTGG